MTAAVWVADTLPVPIAVCSGCGKQYARRDYEALPLAAGYAMGQSIEGLTIRVCTCTDSLTVEEDWCGPGYEFDEAMDPVGTPDVDRGDGDCEEEADYRRERARNERMLDWRGP